MTSSQVRRTLPLIFQIFNERNRKSNGTMGKDFNFPLDLFGKFVTALVQNVNKLICSQYLDSNFLNLNRNVFMLPN